MALLFVLFVVALLKSFAFGAYLVAMIKRAKLQR